MHKKSGRRYGYNIGLVTPNLVKNLGLVELKGLTVVLYQVIVKSLVVDLFRKKIHYLRRQFSVTKFSTKPNVYFISFINDWSLLLTWSQLTFIDRLLISFSSERLRGGHQTEGRLYEGLHSPGQGLERVAGRKEGPGSPQHRRINLSRHTSRHTEIQTGNHVIFIAMMVGQ